MSNRPNPARYCVFSPVNGNSDCVDAVVEAAVKGSCAVDPSTVPADTTGGIVVDVGGRVDVAETVGSVVVVVVVVGAVVPQPGTTAMRSE